MTSPEAGKSSRWHIGQVVHIYNLTSGCCMEDCEVICFPRHGFDGTVVLLLKRGRRHGAAFCCMLVREMCDWIDCNVVFSDDPPHGEAVIGEQ